MLNSLITGLMQGQFANHPLMKQVQSMLQGKSKQEQIQTLINTAQTLGLDINEKRFTAEQLQRLGIKLP